MNVNTSISKDDAEEINDECPLTMETLRNTTRAGRQIVASVVD
jgi:hypothetical protein